MINVIDKIKESIYKMGQKRAMRAIERSDENCRRRWWSLYSFITGCGERLQNSFGNACLVISTKGELVDYGFDREVLWTRSVINSKRSNSMPFVGTVNELINQLVTQVKVNPRTIISPASKYFYGEEFEEMSVEERYHKINVYVVRLQNLEANLK